MKNSLLIIVGLIWIISCNLNENKVTKNNKKRKELFIARKNKSDNIRIKDYKEEDMKDSVKYIDTLICKYEENIYILEIHTIWLKKGIKKIRYIKENLQIHDPELHERILSQKFYFYKYDTLLTIKTPPDNYLIIYDSSGIKYKCLENSYIIGYILRSNDKNKPPVFALLGGCICGLNESYIIYSIEGEIIYYDWVVGHKSRKRKIFKSFDGENYEVVREKVLHM